MKPKLFDVVRTLRPLCDGALEIGSTGAVILVFEEPSEAYEVEFVDDEGRATAILTLQREDFEIVRSG